MNLSIHHTLQRLLLPALVCLTLVPLAPLTAQAGSVAGSGRSATESRSLAEFQALALSGSMDLVLRQGAVQSVQVQADDNLLPLLETVVESTGNGATLLVRWKKGQSLHTRSKVLVTVVVPKLSAVAASGSGDIRVEAFNTPALKLSLSGSGDARLQGLTTEELGLSISGSSDVVASGSATRLKISIAGSGDVRMADLKSDEVTVNIAGSGDVSYTGNAAVKSRVAGSGSVNKR